MTCESIVFYWILGFALFVVVFRAMFKEKAGKMAIMEWIVLLHVWPMLTVVSIVWWAMDHNFKGEKLNNKGGPML